MRHLLLPTVVLFRGCEGSSDFTGDSYSLISQPLSASFPDLSPALTECHSRAAASAGCQTVQYLAELRDLIASDVLVGDVQSKLETISSDVSYGQIFSDYMEKGRTSLEIRGPSNHTETSDLFMSVAQATETLSKLSQCLDGTPPEVASGGVSLQEVCPSLLDDENSPLRVPGLIANDYLARLTEDVLSPGKTDPSGLQANAGSAFASALIVPPTVLHLGATASTRHGHACELGHTALFEVLAGSVEVTLGSAADGNFGKSSSTLHRFEYDRGSSKASGTLGPRSQLLVPFTNVVSLGSMNGEATLLKYCFVDASSLNLAKAVAHVAAHSDGSTSGSSGSSGAAALVASALSSPRLDTSMLRTPRVLSWSEHRLWPRSDSAASKSEPGSGGRVQRSARKSQKEWQAETKWKWRIIALTLPTVAPPIVRHVERGSATLGWLTAFTVTEGDATPCGYRVLWYEAHQASAAGEVEVGHEWLEARGDLKHAYDDLHAHQVEYALPEGSLKHGTEYRFRVVVFYGEASSPKGRASLPVTTPPLAPPARMNTAPKLLSEASHSGEATALGEVASATRLVLTVPPPIDDGGSPVLGYIVEVRHAEEGMLSGWVVHGAYPDVRSGPWVKLEVDDLVPDSTYQFRVRPYNMIGVAPEPGSPSQPIPTGSRAAGSPGAAGSSPGLVLLGHGAREVATHHVDLDEESGEEEPEVVAHLEGLFDPHVFMVHGPVVTLCDSTQSFAYEGGSAPIWAAHYSPRKFRVTAELIATDPPAACVPLKNARAVRGRVALVERGGCAMVDKALSAQAAGAIAVLIADTGQCKAFDQSCSAGAEKKNGEGFGRLDVPAPWGKLRIPVAMILKDDADKILSLFE